MTKWKLALRLTPIAALVLSINPAAAQSTEREVTREVQVEREYAERLREAEAQMAEAARQIAEITSQRVPQIAQIERRFEFSNRPRIGVTMESKRSVGPVDGVAIDGVTPGSAAADAGLRANDIITAVNDEKLSADSSSAANEILLDFMKGVEEGDVLKIEYLRNGNAGTVDVTPRVGDMQVFAWAPDMDFQVKRLPGLGQAPRVIQGFRSDFGFPFAGSSLGHMELVELNEGLGKYFGTDRGLLVVSAPDAGDFDLRDGDVIQSIDGREPKDVRHALRILSSYQSGESLKLGIMRDKKKRTLDVEIPADHRGHSNHPVPDPAKPAKAPAPAVAPTPAEAST